MILKVQGRSCAKAGLGNLVCEDIATRLHKRNERRRLQQVLAAIAVTPHRMNYRSQIPSMYWHAVLDHPPLASTISGTKVAPWFRAKPSCFYAFAFSACFWTVDSDRVARAVCLECTVTSKYTLLPLPAIPSMSELVLAASLLFMGSVRMCEFSSFRNVSAWRAVVP